MVFFKTSSFYSLFFTAQLHPAKTNPFSSDTRHINLQGLIEKMTSFLKFRKKKLITAAAIAVYFFGINSANAATAEGKIIIFPWVMEGTTAEFNTSVKTQLSKALENAAGSLGQISQLSEEYDRSPNKVRNIAKAMKNFLMITPPKQVPLEDTIIVQPYMCKAGDKMIATIVSHAWKKREILSINHQSFEQSSLFKKRIKKTNFL